MLYDEFQYSLLVIRYGAAVTGQARYGQDPSLGCRASCVTGNGHDAYGAVGTRHTVPEEGVTRFSNDLLSIDSECLLSRTVHPDHGMFGVVDYDDVVNSVENHVHELLGVYFGLLHGCHATVSVGYLKMLTNVSIVIPCRMIRSISFYSNFVD